MNTSKDDSFQSNRGTQSNSIERGTSQSLFEFKRAHDFQRVQPLEKKMSCWQRMKDYVSNEIHWEEMAERNILFNYSKDQNEEDDYGQQMNNNQGKSIKEEQDGVHVPFLQTKGKQANGKGKGKGKDISEFCSNKICTSKYTLINFFFLNMYEQFTKLANLYFLAMGLFQMIPAISSSEGIPYVYLPLSFIIIITAIKDVVEDMRRHQSDSKENEYPVFKFQNNEFVHSTSKCIEVGDIIKITHNHSIPADIVLLFSSTQEEGHCNQARRKGVCYLETKNLDGETSLKSKYVSKGVQKIIDHEDKLSLYEGMLKSEGPNPYLYKYSGSLRFFSKDDSNSSLRRIHVEEEHFVLRGCTLRNTEFIIGVVAFTGHETKIMLNSNRPRPKKSKVELDMNREIMLIWMSQMIFCTISALYSLFWFIQNKSSLGYLYLENDTVSQNFLLYFVIRYGNWLIIFINFVPISLLITLDLIRISQAIVISRCKKMISFHKIEYSEEKENLDRKDIFFQENQVNNVSQQSVRKSQEEGYTKISPAVQSSNLNEDLVDESCLGQIKCVFSDKTGTLTCNIMNLKAIIFDGEIHGDINSREEKNQSLSGECMIIPQAEENRKPKMNKKKYINYQQKLEEFTEEENNNIKISQEINNVSFVDPSFIQRAYEGSDKKLERFLEHLAICHTVVYSENSEGSNGNYQSPSPDELALVNFAKLCGIEFKGHDENETISLLGNRVSQEGEHVQKERNFKLLQILYFTSERKRMSVIVEYSDGQIVLLTKGADSVVIPRLRIDNEMSAESEEITSLQYNLHRMSKEGLRTLVMTYRSLDVEYFHIWQDQFDEAQNIVGDQKEIILNGLMDEMEQNLTLLGATGIEDKLQQDVQDTVTSLKMAGITVWILTGDKRETAVNIALCSKIVDNERIIEIFESNEQDLENQLLEIRQTNNKIEQAVCDLTLQADKLSRSINEDRNESDMLVSSVSEENNLKQRMNEIPSNKCKEKSEEITSPHQINISPKEESYEKEDCVANSNFMDIPQEQNSLEYYLSQKAYSLVIEGYSMDIIMKSDKRMQRLFQETIKSASSVVACRVSPKQKQQLVSMYKQFFPKHRTLAIGDGANDVNMLTEAHVGIGIQGLEGLQAARASDYSIGEFRLLKRLLLVYGRECYRKNSSVILYNFYKNIVYLIPLFWFGVYSGFSGSFIYDQLLFQCFNTFFTSLPIVIYAIRDKDLSSKVLMTVPFFYRFGIQNRFFNTSILWQWFFNGVFQAFVLSGISIFVLDSANPSGHESGVFVLGQMMFGTAIIIVNSKVLIFSNTQYLLNILVCIFSFLLYVIFASFFNFIQSNMLYLEFSKLIQQPYVLCAFLLVIVMTCLFDYGHNTYVRFDYLKQLQDALHLDDNHQNLLLDSFVDISFSQKSRENSKKDKNNSLNED